MSDKIHEGQEVSWKWGSGNPSGTVAEVVSEGKAEVTSNKVGTVCCMASQGSPRLQGHTVSRNAKEGDPAVKITRKGNDVVKLAHELNEVKDSE
ncbi:hypothetical protein EIP86_005276 [Pleurotus ostreatoroseus]|nr:hypothetical protein EIP86_005276 [Pleurotus ostreatoroseus]